MRGRRIVAAWLLLVAGCSKAPEAGDTPDLSGNASASVAFTYGYTFELPSRAIGDLQEAHAQACERAGRQTCRITGLSYRVDRDGAAYASLSVKVAAGLARRFGRNAIGAANGFGATLVGAEITGEDVQPAAAEADATRRSASADASAAGRTLGDPRLSAAERADLRARQAGQLEAARAGAAVVAEQAERLANTPMSFSYQPGHGVGFGNALRDSAGAASASTRTTLIAAVWIVATAGPPAVLLLLLWLAWRRWGRRLWARLTREPH